MSLHYLDESKRYRDCPDCYTGRWEVDMCLTCEGRGKLGDPDAKHEIEVVDFSFDEWYWQRAYSQACYHAGVTNDVLAQDWTA